MITVQEQAERERKAQHAQRLAERELETARQGLTQAKRPRRAKWLFQYLDSKGLGPGCHDWDGLDEKARNAYEDAIAILEDALAEDHRNTP